MDSKDIQELAHALATQLQNNLSLPIKQVLFSDFCETYMETYAKPYKSFSSWDADLRRIRNHIRPALGDRQLVEVTREDVVALFTRIGQQYPYQANRVLEQLKVMFKQARLNGYYPEQKVLPTDEIKAFREYPRKDVVEESQMPLLAASINKCQSPRMKALFWLYLLTGCRCSELRLAEWSWLSTTKRQLIIPAHAAKSRETCVVNLSVEALAIIARQPRGSHFIFAGDKAGKPLNRSSVWKSWNKIRKQANVEHITIHGLRHTYASWALQSGFSLKLISRMLNHKSTQPTEVYLHLFEKDVVEAADAIAKRMTPFIEMQEYTGLTLVKRGRPLGSRKRA